MKRLTLCCPSDAPSPPTVNATEEVELQVRPHPQDTSIVDCTIRNLATVPAATVAHIVKYITDYPSVKKGMLTSFYVPVTCNTAFSIYSAGKQPQHESHSSNSDHEKYTLYIQLGESGKFMVRYLFS